MKATPEFLAEWDKVTKMLRNSGMDLSSISITREESEYSDKCEKEVIK